MSAVDSGSNGLFVVLNDLLASSCNTIPRRDCNSYGRVVFLTGQSIEDKADIVRKSIVASW